MEFVLRTDVAGLDDGAGMGHAGGQPHQDRNLVFFRKVKGLADHGIRLLLGGRFEARDHGEIGIEAGILFVLRGMHGRVVTGSHDKSAARTGHRGAHETVGADIHAHMFHTDKRTFPAVGNAERRLHGGLFIAAPVAVDVPLPRERMTLDILGYFGGRCTGIGIDTGKTGVQGAQRQRFIPQKQMFFSHIAICVLNYVVGLLQN